MSVTRFTAAVVGGFLLFVGAGMAQEEPPVKLAFVDVQRAILSIDEGKARLQVLQDWAKPLQDELVALNKEITALQTELAAKQAVANEATLAELNRKLVDKQRAFEDKQRKSKREFEERQEVILKDLGNKLNEVITRYADTNRFTAVFILKPNDLIYLANSADITETVVKLYNERFPFQAAAAGTTK